VVQVAQAGRVGRAGQVVRWHRVAIAAAAASLTVLTAAAGALSYPSVHDLAAKVGVSPDLARVYPVLFDALLVIAGCSVLALRGAGLPAKLYAWTCLVLVLAGLAVGSAADSARVSIPHRPAEIAAAVIPWTLVLAGLILLLLLLRYARLRKSAPTSEIVWLSPPVDVEPRGELEMAEFVLTAEQELEPESEPEWEPEPDPEPGPPELLRLHSSPTPPRS
jgi:hypothetical protein